MRGNQYTLGKVRAILMLAVGVLVLVVYLLAR